jgi:murein DD-endopeptidase MepM/ murein hydrolase activator NlpD
MRAGIGAFVLLLVSACVAVPAPVERVSEPGPVRKAAPATPPPLPVAPRFVLMGEAVQGGVLTGIAPEGATRLMFDGQLVAPAADGRFLIAFDRDAGPVARLTAMRGESVLATETLAVRAREWRIERLPNLPRFRQPSAEFQRRRGPELAQIAAARAVETGAQGWRQDFLWPVTGRISGLFGAQRIYAGEPGAYHSGVDVARPTGTPVVAPADGVVVLASKAPFTIEGMLLLIDHGMGLNSAFLHLSRIDVREGEAVQRGQRIGTVGATGRATGPHLHWGMKWRDARIDPLLLAGVMAGE